MVNRNYCPEYRLCLSMFEGTLGCEPSDGHVVEPANALTTLVRAMIYLDGRPMASGSRSDRVRHRIGPRNDGCADGPDPKVPLGSIRSD